MRLFDAMQLFWHASRSHWRCSSRLLHESFRLKRKDGDTFQHWSSNILFPANAARAVRDFGANDNGYHLARTVGNSNSSCALAIVSCVQNESLRYFSTHLLMKTAKWDGCSSGRRFPGDGVSARLLLFRAERHSLQSPFLMTSAMTPSAYNLVLYFFDKLRRSC